MHPEINQIHQNYLDLQQRVSNLETLLTPKKVNQIKGSKTLPKKYQDGKHRGNLIWEIKEYHMQLNGDIHGFGKQYLPMIKEIVDKTESQFPDYSMEQLELEIKNRLKVYKAWCDKQGLMYGLKGAATNWPKIPNFKKEIEVSLLTMEDICGTD